MILKEARDMTGIRCEADINVGTAASHRQVQRLRRWTTSPCYSYTAFLHDIASVQHNPSLKRNTADEKNNVSCAADSERSLQILSAGAKQIEEMKSI